MSLRMKDLASTHHLDDTELVRRIVGTHVDDAQGLLRDLMHESTYALEAALGGRRTARLRAALELGRRVNARMRRVSTRTLPHAEAVYEWSQERLTQLDHEELWTLAVDVKNQLRSARLVSKGGVLGVVISTRDILREVLREGAPAFVLVHNHPSGDPTPSPEDVEFTERVAAAADAVGVPLLDHVVVGRDGYVSLAPRLEANQWISMNETDELERR